MASCPKCAAELVGSAKFCAACGAPIALSGAPSVASPTPSPAAVTFGAAPVAAGVGLVVARPDGAHGLVAAVRGPIGAGASVVVGADDAFFAVSGGRAGAPFPPGRHVLAEGCELGVFLRGRPERVAFSGDLGEARDASGTTARLRTQGSVEVSASAPPALVSCLASLAPEDRDDVIGYLRGVVLGAMKQAVQQGCGVLGWGVGDVLSGAKTAELVPLVASTYDASPRKLPGIAVRLVEASFNGELSGPLPQPAPPSVALSQVNPLASTARGSMGVMPGHASPVAAPPGPYGPPLPPIAGPPPVSRVEAQVSPAAVSGYGGPPPASSAAAYGAVAGPPQQWAASLPNMPPPAPFMAQRPPGQSGPQAPLPATAPAPPGYIASSPTPYAAPQAPQPIPQPPPQPYAMPAPSFQPQFPQGVPHVAPYAGQYVPYGAQPPAPPPYAPQQAAPPPQFGAGARVLVQWADGNRYPGTVQQAMNGQCLVMFPNGQQQWVAVQYLYSSM